MEESKTGYGKRPMWQWILIYIVIGGLIYAGIYYFFIAKNGGYSTDYGTSESSTQESSPNGY